MKILVVLAHPALHRSRINSSLAEVAREHPRRRQVVDLYNTYPDFEIQVGQEQDRLRAADVIVLQHPFYWYSTPALLKEWVDLVFQHGFAYGEDSNELAGKILTQAISTGGDADAYTKDGFNGFSIEELSAPCRQPPISAICAGSSHSSPKADISLPTRALTPPRSATGSGSTVSVSSPARRARNVS